MFYDEIMSLFKTNEPLLRRIIEAIIKEKFVVYNYKLSEYFIKEEIVDVNFLCQLPGTQNYIIRNEIIYAIFIDIKKKQDLNLQTKEKEVEQIKLNTNTKRKIKICKKKG